MKDTIEEHTGEAETPPKGGAPKGNSNAARHYLRAGKLPAELRYLEVQTNLLRRELESAVVAAKGEISMTDAAYIQSIFRWERHAALAQRFLVKEYDNLKSEQRLFFSREIAEASTKRDKAMSMLQLNRDAVRDAWSVLDAIPALSAPTPAQDK